MKPPIMAREDPYFPAQIQIADEDLRGQLAVGTPNLTRDESGLLHVAVPIRATTNLQVYIDYRITFVDANGQVLSQSSWTSKTLAPNVFDQIQVNSMSAQAANFQLDLRYAK